MQTPKTSLWLQAILGTLLAFASISTDLYLPALPRMAEALDAPQSVLEWTVSGYLLGFGLGQLLWGPISDRFGRRLPVATGIAIFCIGAAGCAMSTSAGPLLFWRLVQALGASAGVVLARAMVRDLYDRDHGARVLSTLMTVMAIAPMIGPTLGGQILRLADWPAIFWLLVAFGLATLAALTRVPETLPPERRTTEPLRSAFANYADLMRNRQLVGYCIGGGFYFVGIFAYVAGSPFAFIEYYGLSPQLYGLVFAAATAGLMLTNTINARLVTRMRSDRLLIFGTTGAAAAGLLVLVTATTGLGGLIALAATLCLYIALNGFIVANLISSALATVTVRVGAASALLGAAQYGSGMIGSAAVGALANGTPAPMGWVVALAGCGTALATWWASRGAKAEA